MKRLIGICGKAGAGKDTVATFLTQQGFIKDSFASPLKDAVSCIFGWDRELLEGITEESREFREEKDIYWSAVFGKDITPRYILQYFGTEVCRENLHKNIWIESFKHRVRNSINDIVIADVRFINEAEAIKEMGGYVLFIKRPDLVKEYSHASEQDIENIGRFYSDMHLINDNTLEQFNALIKEWYVSIY